MKMIYLSRQTIKIVLLIFMANLISTSCSAHAGNGNNSGTLLVSTDSVMYKALGDSIYSIVVKAKKIRANVITMDSASLQNEISVKRNQTPLVKFVLSDPKIYKDATPAYGSFIPCFSLTFIKKKEICMAKFDFGLKKWAIYDNSGTCLKTFNLSSDDMLRVANLLFPDNQHFQSLINGEKK